MYSDVYPKPFQVSEVSCYKLQRFLHGPLSAWIFLTLDRSGVLSVNLQNLFRLSTSALSDGDSSSGTLQSWVSFCTLIPMWWEDKVNSFAVQPATNRRHWPYPLQLQCSNICQCTLTCNSFILIFRPSNFFKLINILQYQISYIISSTYKFFYFRRSAHNILSNYLKFYSKCFKSSAIIFPKFLETFHEVFVPNFSKFLTTFPKFVLIFL